MIQATGLRWILTVLFVLLAAYAAWRAVAGHGSLVQDGRHPGTAARVGHALHAVMAAAMAAMVWSWGMGLPARPQVAFFTLAALWFAGIALAFPGDAPRSTALLAAFPHALVMGAMAWMVYAMAAAMSGHHEMDSMEQASGEHAHHGAGTSAMSSMTLQGGARAAAGALAVVLLALTLWWLAQAFDLGRVNGGTSRVRAEAAAEERGGEQDAWDLGWHGVMAFGMAVIFALLV